jgi:hypothetical protein
MLIQSPNVITSTLTPIVHSNTKLQGTATRMFDCAPFRFVPGRARVKVTASNPNQRLEFQLSSHRTGLRDPPTTSQTQGPLRGTKRSFNPEELQTCDIGLCHSGATRIKFTTFRKGLLHSTSGPSRQDA